MLLTMKQQLERITGGMRREPRKLAFNPVYHRYANLPWILSKTLDISENGARILTNDLFNEGDELILKLSDKKFQRNEVLSIKTRVAWAQRSTHGTHPYECGVSFQDRSVTYLREKSFVDGLANINCLFLQNYTKDCIGKTVNNIEDLKAAYELLYNEYSSRNLCSPNEARLYYNFYSLTPGARTFVLKRGKDILGTISIILDSPAGLPMEATYPDEIRRFRAQGMRLGEIGCLALNSRFFSSSRYSLGSIEKQAHLFKLFKTMTDYARHVTNCTDMVMGCHPRHTALYKYLDLEEIGEVRDHQEVGGAPAVLMKLNFERVSHHKTLLNEGPWNYLLQPCESIPMLREHFPWTSQTVGKFLHQFRPLWQQLSTEQREYIVKVYPSI